jgi:hypothetical protein
VVQWTVIGAAIAALCWPPSRKRLTGLHTALSGWLVVTAAALFMMTRASVRIWELVQPLAFLQFPWRLLMLPTIACGVVAALLLTAVRNRTTQALIVTCAVAFQWHVTKDYLSTAWNRPRMPIDLEDPNWMSTAAGRPWVFRERSYDPISVTQEPKPTSERWTIVEGRGDVNAVSSSDTSVALTIRVHDPVRLIINSPFFPGWRVAMDGEIVPPAIRPGSGYMQIRVPSGEHQVVASFGRTHVRASAEAITLVSAAIWTAMACWTARSGYRSRRASSPRAPD